MLAACRRLIRLTKFASVPSRRTGYQCERKGKKGKSGFHVTLVGAGGGIGQPLSLLLKQSPLISSLNLHGLKGAKGVAVDLSHIETPTKVRGFDGREHLTEALQGADIVVVVAGQPRKPGMTRADLFTANADIIVEVACGVAAACPTALVAIVTNPVNSMTPLFGQVLESQRKCDPRKVFGVTTLDVVRANMMLAELKGQNPLHVHCPVIGGHSGDTIVPVLSQACPKVSLTEDETKKFVQDVKDAGTVVVKAKGKGSSTLSIAFATARFVFALCRGLHGEKGVVECSYVRSDITDSRFFSSLLVLGKEGVEQNLGLGALNDFECNAVQHAVKLLIEEVQKGECYATADGKKPCSSTDKPGDSCKENTKPSDCCKENTKPSESGNKPC